MSASQQTCKLWDSWFHDCRRIKGTVSSYLLSLWKAKTCLPWINWITKIVVRFCYLRLYLAVDRFLLLQRMARMDMHWNLEKLGQPFHVLILCKSHQKIIMVIAPYGSLFDIFFITLKSILCMGQGTKLWLMINTE